MTQDQLDIFHDNIPAYALGALDAEEIYADPPWRYATTGKSGSRLRIENQYPTMTTAEICALPAEEICDKDATLFLWVPSSLLRDGLDVMNAWGFEYLTQAVWHKKGGKAPFMGGIFQQAHETLLVGKRGNGPQPLTQKTKSRRSLRPLAASTAKSRIRCMACAKRCIRHSRTILSSCSPGTNGMAGLAGGMRYSTAALLDYSAQKRIKQQN